MAVSGSRSRIGGVPVITVEAPAPRRAVLAFRVGRADETLPIGGITHLVEHLALLPFQEQPYQYGGVVEGDRTIFWVQGSEAEIGEFFGKLCANLANLPLDRLADQARILETEARSRKHSAVESLLNIRYGSRGWGSMVFPEYGLMRPDPDRVRQWAERWFTAGNAALGVSGPADGISLELRPGNRMPPPDLNPVPIRTPAWMHQRQPGIAIGFIGPRSIQFAALLRTLVRHGRTRLRFEESLSYEVSHHTVRLTDGLSHGSLWADGLPESMSRVWTGLLAVIDQLRSEGPSEAELREDVEMLRKDIIQHGRWRCLTVSSATNCWRSLPSPPMSCLRRSSKQRPPSTRRCSRRCSRVRLRSFPTALPSSIAVSPPSRSGQPTQRRAASTDCERRAPRSRDKCIAFSWVSRPSAWLMGRVSLSRFLTGIARPFWRGMMAVARSSPLTAFGSTCGRRTGRAATKLRKRWTRTCQKTSASRWDHDRIQIRKA